MCVCVRREREGGREGGEREGKREREREREKEKEGERERGVGGRGKEREEREREGEDREIHYFTSACTHIALCAYLGCPCITCRSCTHPLGVYYTIPDNKLFEVVASNNIIGGSRAKQPSQDHHDATITVEPHHFQCNQGIHFRGHDMYMCIMTCIMDVYHGADPLIISKLHVS